MNVPYRWHVIIHYRTDTGSLDVEHDIEELDELQDIIERGPDWNTILCIDVKLARKTDKDMTL